MLQSELNQILDSHELWVEDNKKGKKADLSNQNLSGLDFSERNLKNIHLSFSNFSDADFSHANLAFANLYSVFFSFVNLSNANLSYVNLSHANLSCANLSRANLSEAYLSSANLSYADLSYADLSNVDFSNSNLSYAKLSYANLSNVDFYNANLYNAHLSFSNIEAFKFPNFRICPEEGQFYGFEKVQGNFILKLLISKHAKRLNPIGYRQCRASKVKVIEAYNPDGSKTNQTKFKSRHDPKFEYEINKWVEVKDFNDDVREIYAPGIHFFLTKEEAITSII